MQALTHRCFNPISSHGVNYAIRILKVIVEKLLEKLQFLACQTRVIKEIYKLQEGGGQHFRRLKKY